jgi:hypothetical protein
MSHTHLRLDRVRVSPMGKKSSPYLYPSGRVPGGYRITIPELPSLLVIDMLATFISRAREEGQIDGLVPHLVKGGLSILQYVDGIILFMDHNLEQKTKI